MEHVSSEQMSVNNCLVYSGKTGRQKYNCPVDVCICDVCTVYVKEVHVCEGEVCTVYMFEVPNCTLCKGMALASPFVQYKSFFVHCTIVN